MAELANQKGAEVCIGYARNVHSCCKKGRASMEKSLASYSGNLEISDGDVSMTRTPDLTSESDLSPEKRSDLRGSGSASTRVTFHHNNSFKEEDMEDCFVRNREGMLMNMACHELAEAVKFFNLTPSACADSATLHHSDSVLAEHAGIEDFVRLKFSVFVEVPNQKKRKQPVELVFEVDRQGGDWAGVSVMDNENSNELFTLPEDMTKYKQTLSENPSIVPYLLMQQECYCEMLGSFACGDWGSLVGLEEGVRVIDCAEILTGRFKKELKGMSPVEGG